MAYIAKLTHGARTLDLNAGRYMLDDDFVPPPTNYIPTLAGGGSANRTGGSRKVGQRAVDRSWTFTVNIDGASDAEIQRGANDLEAFLALAGDPATPLYFEYKANADTPEPLWGNYGTNLKYEIVHASPPRPEMFGVSTLRARHVPHAVALIIKPFAVGKRQRLASATGGILEDIISTTDGISRGTMIPEVTTNHMTNPIFGHATWDNGWIKEGGGATNLVAEKNIDPEFVLFGNASAKVRSRGTTNNVFYQNINVGSVATFAFVAFIKLPDGSTPTSADVVLHYSPDDLATTFTHIGNGWYMARGTDTGIAALTPTGIRVKNGRTVYLGCYHTTGADFGFPPAHGDMLGNAWTGTAHASTTSRTAARIRMPIGVDTFDYGQGTIRIVWRAHKAQSDYGANALIFGDGTFRAAFVAATDTIEFNDGTNAAGSSALTFGYGTEIVLHFTWGTAGIRIYINGSPDGSNATYTAPAAAANLYIGSDTGAANQLGGTLMDFATFDVALTAAQILADYNNISQLTADDQRVGTIPFLWTKDGDDIVDNGDDSSLDNWCVCGGIPGSAPAETEIKGNLSSGFGTIQAVWLSLIDMDPFIKVADLVFGDQSGTADATAVGGAYEGATIDTNVNVNFDKSGLNSFNIQAVADREFYTFFRLHDNGSNLQAAAQTFIGGSIATDYINLSTAASYRLFKTLPIKIANLASVFGDQLDQALSPWFRILLKRTTGSATVQVDWIFAIFRPLLRIRSSVSGISDSGFIVKGREGSIFNNTTLLFNNNAELAGDIIELVPNRYNTLMDILVDEGQNPLITYTLTYTHIVVIPRWSLL